MDLSHVSIWEQVLRKVCEAEVHSLKKKKKNREGDWTNILAMIFKTDRSDFLLQIKMDSNSFRLPIGARGDIGRTSLA